MTLPLILLAIPELDLAGPDRVFWELLCHLPRDRFRLAVAVGRPGGRYYNMLPADIVPEVIGGGRYPVRLLAQAIDRLRPDLLLTTLRMNLTAAFALMLARHQPVFVARQANAIGVDFAALKKKSLVKHRLAEKITLFALRRADGVVAQSHDMAEELIVFVRPRQMLVTIGNPVDIGELRHLAAAQRDRAAALAGHPALVSVGRLAPQKGYDLLVTALPLVRAVHPQAALTILGDGVDRVALTAQAAALGVGDALHLPGVSDTVHGMLARADLFVSSSRYEGFPNVVLEAMAVGTPVAATRCPGGTAELVIDGKTGWLAQDLAPAAIAATILAALAGDTAGVTAAALANIQTLFSRARIMAAYSGLFDDMLGPRA